MEKPAFSLEFSQCNAIASSRQKVAIDKSLKTQAKVVLG